VEHPDQLRNRADNLRNVGRVGQNLQKAFQDANSWGRGRRLVRDGIYNVNSLLLHYCWQIQSAHGLPKRIDLKPELGVI